MKRLLSACCLSLLVFTSHNASAALLTFSDAISGATTYQFDGDGDGNADVIFSTLDQSGFNTVGPGPNMTYINEPGLEGTSLLPTDLRVDFLVGALNSIQFGFALSSGSESPNTWAKFDLFDKNGNLLTSAAKFGEYTATQYGQSSFPEGLLALNFTGVAAYGLFDFSSDGGRYIIDNFSGTFGTTEVVPEPSTFILFGAGLGGLALWRRKQRK